MLLNIFLILSFGVKLMQILYWSLDMKLKGYKRNMKAISTTLLCFTPFNNSTCNFVQFTNVKSNLTVASHELKIVRRHHQCQSMPHTVVLKSYFTSLLVILLNNL